MAVIGDLVTRLSANTKPFESGLDRAKSKTTSFARDVASIVSGIAIADIGKKIAGGLFDAGRGMVGLAAQAETMRIEMEVLLGSTEKGAKMFSKLEKFAMRTSFSLESASSAVTGLLAKGVPEQEVMSTLEMLGNLSSGSAEKLQLIAKAYTDVRAKGKLAAGETNQFAENGVNILEALSRTTGKTVGQLIEMREQGAISFEMVAEAMKSMTSEGGRFSGMMDRMNKTFTGQWNSLVEAIQGVGRELGMAVLPTLTEMVTKANDFVGAFQAMGNQKWTWLSDVLVASWDVAIEHIKLNWAKMLNDLIDKVAKINWSKLLNPFAGVKIDDLRPGMAPKDLNEAKKRLDDLMREGRARQAAMANEERAAAMREQRKGKGEAPKGAGLGAMIGGFAEKLKPIVGGVADAAKGKVEEWKMRGQWIANTFRNMWDGDKKKTNREPQFSGAMQRGSAEAFSTILAAMGNKSANPQVKAIEKGVAEQKKMNEHLAQMKKQGNFILVGDIK